MFVAAKIQPTEEKEMRHFKLVASGVLMACSLAGMAVVFGARGIVEARGLEVGGQRRHGPSWVEGARLIISDGNAPSGKAAFAVVGDSYTGDGRKGEER